MISSTSVLGCYNRPERRINPSDSVDDPDLLSIIEDINTLKEKIKDSPRSSWKRPAHIRKRVMIIKLNALTRQIARNDPQNAYDKMVNDIKPKLTYSWVTNKELQATFRVDCNNILDKIEALMTPDVDPPTIILTPDQTISDEDAIGGFLLQWEITDESGILDATVKVNGQTIASYNGYGSISDSYLLVNIPGNNLVEITAVDTNGLVSLAQSTISIVDDDTTGPTIAIIYVGSGTDFDSGWWNIDIEDPESGIDEVELLINGYEYLHETNLNGQSSVSYQQVWVPGSVGTHALEVVVKNNDNDWNGDQESSTDTDAVDIIHDPNPPPLIIG